MELMRPIRYRAHVVVALLLAGIVVDAVTIGLDLVDISLLTQLVNGETVAFDAFVRNDARQSAASTADLVVLVATAVAFIAWFHAAYVHARGGGARLRHSEGWAVGAWCVPLLNLVRPKQIADDLWRASAPAAEAPAAGRRSLRLLDGWWGLWTVASIGGLLVTRVAARTADTWALRGLSGLHVVVLALYILSAVWAIRVVRGLTARQESQVRARATSSGRVDRVAPEQGVAPEPA